MCLLHFIFPVSLRQRLEESKTQVIKLSALKEEKMLTHIFMYLGFGAVAGLLAGLLGVGGGLVVVPIVSFTLVQMGCPIEHIQHIAVGTSFSTIVFTSISSFSAHHKRGSVAWPIVFKISPAIVIGVLVGGYVASFLHTTWLQIIFLLFLSYAASQMLLDIKPKSSRELPGTVGLGAAGGFIGFISSLVGIGGGTLIIPFLTWCNVPMRMAVGSSAAIGLPIAVTGAVIYVVTGWGVEGLPEYSFGYIYLPALIGIATASVLTAPLGSAISHRLPIPMLKKAFAALIIVVGLRMLWTMF